MTLLTESPLVVGTVTPAGLDALAGLPAASRVADIIEVRLDLAMAEGPLGSEPAPLPDIRRFMPLCRRLGETGTPVLATLRLVADGGRWTADASRLPLFDAALTDGRCAWVDIEIESVIADHVIRLARRSEARVIVSHHDFSGTAQADALDEIVERARRLGADIVKLATRVDTLEDHDRLIELLRRHRQRDDALAVIGMGAVGRPLRTYLPAIGSRLTYGFVDTSAAPGQIPVAELVSRLVADCPAYAAHREKQAARA
ncbi:MAG TPA: type I 3-dehydroquinate dehydratase [Polyangia bacterium]|jgi:3-dehydroquinate dehydratase-1